MYYINTPNCECLLNIAQFIHSFDNIQISKVGKEEKNVQRQQHIKKNPKT